MLLLNMMKMAGYGDCRKQKKSMKFLYEKSVCLAEKEFGIKCTARDWAKKHSNQTKIGCFDKEDKQVWA